MLHAAGVAVDDVLPIFREIGMIDIDLGQLNAVAAQLLETAAEFFGKPPDVAGERSKLVVAPLTAAGLRGGLNQASTWRRRRDPAQAPGQQDRGQHDQKGEIEPEEERRRSAGEKNTRALNQKRVEHLHATPTLTRVRGAHWPRPAPVL